MSMFSIATTTVGSGGVSSITFSSIPSTFTHLQVRLSFLSQSGGGVLYSTLNGDSGSNYAWHSLYGIGTGVGNLGSSSQTSMRLFGFYSGSSTTSPTSVIIDLLDYTNTNKYKTIKCLSGVDTNGAGEADFASGLWMNTNSVTSLTLTPLYGGSGFSQYTTVQLYGITTA